MNIPQLICSEIDEPQHCKQSLLQPTWCVALAGRALHKLVDAMPGKQPQPHSVCQVLWTCDLVLWQYSSVCTPWEKKPKRYQSRVELHGLSHAGHRGNRV